MEIKLSPSSVRDEVHNKIQVAVLIGWGYQTSGDFDEALRLYSEIDRLPVDLNPVEMAELEKMFQTEFEETE